MRNLAPQLAAYDRLVRELAEVRARLAGVPEEMQALHDEYTATRAEIDAVASAAEEARRERIEREGQVVDAQEKLSRYQKQVSLVRNQREYGALLTEIDTAKSTLKSLEEGVIELLERAEEATLALEEKRAASVDIESRHAAALAEWEEKKPSVAARGTELQEEVARLRAALPRAVTAQYERLAERYGGTALAPLLQVERASGAALWHCGGCNYHVRPQVAVEIRVHGNIVQCDGCRRFLYSQDET